MSFLKATSWPVVLQVPLIIGWTRKDTVNLVAAAKHSMLFQTGEWFGRFQKPYYRKQ